jgi:hypothetical protein
MIWIGHRMSRKGYKDKQDKHQDEYDKQKFSLIGCRTSRMGGNSTGRMVYRTRRIG